MPPSLQTQIVQNKKETKQLVQSVVATLERMDQRIKELEKKIVVLSAPLLPKQ